MHVPVRPEPLLAGGNVFLQDVHQSHTARTVKILSDMPSPSTCQLYHFRQIQLPEQVQKIRVFSPEDVKVPLFLSTAVIIIHPAVMEERNIRPVKSNFIDPEVVCNVLHPIITASICCQLLCDLRKTVPVKHREQKRHSQRLRRIITVAGFFSIWFHFQITLVTKSSHTAAKSPVCKKVIVNLSPLAESIYYKRLFLFKRIHLPSPYLCCTTF